MVLEETRTSTRLDSGDASQREALSAGVLHTDSSKAVLITEAYYPPQVGGISNYLANIVDTLGPNRICCVTAVPANSNTTVDEEAPRVYRVPDLRRKERVRRAAAWSKVWLRVRTRERPNLIVLGTADDSSLGFWLQRRLGIPVVLFAHGNEILSAISHRYDKPQMAFKRATRIIVPSRYTAGLVAEAGSERDRIAVVHPGCDPGFFRPVVVRAGFRERILKGISNRTRVILTVGNLVSRKGHDMVIRAIQLLKNQAEDVVYLIAGDGPYRSDLEKLVMELGVADRVIFAGKLAEEEIPYLYALCDVFVMPSRENLPGNDVEGFGLVFLEANACNKPVVGGRSGGVPEAVLDGETGLLVDPHSAPEIARALQSLLHNPELSRQLGEQGRTRVLREFQWTHVRERVLEVFANARAEGSALRNPT